MLERPNDRVPILVLAGKLQDALFHHPQLAVTALEQSHPLFIACQRFLQPDLAVLQIADDAIQVGQGLFEGQCVGSCVGHGGLKSAV